jgi:hypothetical protein
VETAAPCPPPVSRRLVIGTTVAISGLVLITLVSQYVQAQISPLRLIIDLLVGSLGCALTPTLLRRLLPVARRLPRCDSPAILAVLVAAQRRRSKTQSASPHSV